MSEVDPNGLGQHEAGAKLDDGKIDLSLLTLWPRAINEVCRVGTMGAEKYTRGGFLSVAQGYFRYTAALLRHLLKESINTMDDDPWYDTAAGAKWKGIIRHDAQVAWNALSRLEVKLREEEKNNEAKLKQASVDYSNSPERLAELNRLFADSYGSANAAVQHAGYPGIGITY